MNGLVLKLKKMVPGYIRFWKNYCKCKKKADLISQRRTELFELQRKKGMDSIPVFLISYNRVSFIKRMIKCLEKIGMANIIIIDNASSYPPLLDFYKTLSYKVIRMEKNGGYRVFWENPVFDEYRKSFYIVSDPDIEPIDECPADFVEKFFDILYKYPMARKVGFSLKIDDLPLNGIFTKSVLKWERKYYKTLIKIDQIYYADIDTTFALYLPDELVLSGFREAFRTAYPYQARHIPWYITSNDVTEEDRYYSEHKTNGWWNVVDGKMTPDKEP